MWRAPKTYEDIRHINHFNLQYIALTDTTLSKSSLYLSYDSLQVLSLKHSGGHPARYKETERISAESVSIQYKNIFKN
jgi:hypothetical protein